MNGVNHKILIVFLAVVVLVSTFVITPPKKANAILGVGDVVIDPTNLVQNILQVVKTVWGWYQQISQWIQQNLNISIRDIVAKRIMDYIVNQTIQWIQGGGSPKFVGNWNSFLNGAFNVGAGAAIQQILPGLCSPFSAQLRLTLLPVQQFPPAQCTLNQVVSNINGFYSNFRNGGWVAYTTAWQPNNNYYGATLIAYDEMLRKGTAAMNAAQSEAVAGNGFLSSKKCKGGGASIDQLDSIAVRTGKDTSKWQKDVSGDYCDPSEMQNVTPGAAVGSAVATAIGADAQWAANIQSWTSALVNALINRLIGAGGLALVDATKSDNTRYYPPDISSSTTKYDKQQMISQIQPLIDEWNYILKDKQQALSYASSALGILLSSQAAQNCTTTLTVQMLQADITRINSDISTLQAKLVVASSTINEISVADFMNVNDKMSAISAWRDFTSQYDTQTQELAIQSGSDRDAADKEVKKEKDNLAIAQACQSGSHP